MIHYQHQCWRIGAGDGFHWAKVGGPQTHPYCFRLAHAEGEGDKRRATAQLEIQFSREQLMELAAQVTALISSMGPDASNNFAGGALGEGGT